MTDNRSHWWRRAAGSPRLAAALLVVWAFLCFAPALRGPFFFDDEQFVVKNELVHSLRHIGELYTTSVTQGAGIRGNFYRPNQQLVYAILYAAFGADSSLPYHLVPLLLHLGDGLLLLAWLAALGFPAWPALAGVALFLLHPVQTEAVCYVSAMADPLALAFLLGALLLLTRAYGQGGGALARRLPFVLALGALALATKESAVCVLPMALVTLLALRLSTGRRLPAAAWLTAGSLTVLVGGYVALKLTVLDFTGSLGLTEESNAYTESLVLRLKTFVSVLWDYAALLGFPRTLNYEKPYRAYADLFTARGAFGLAVLAGTLAALATARSRPRLALGGACVGAAFLPFTGVIPLNAMYLEHWLYVPMVGLALLLATLLAHLGTGRLARVGGALVAVALLAASWRTAARAADWADVERFYLNELAVAGPSARILNNLGMYYEDHQALVEATRYYRLAASEPGSRMSPQPHHNLARVLARKGDLPAAVAELHAALRIDPGFVYSLAFLRDIYQHVGDAERARTAAEYLAAAESGHAHDLKSLETALFDGSSP